MKPKGHRESRFHGSMQGFLRLLLIQITVFFAASSAQSCGGNLLAEGWLVSPGFPFSYENNMDCVWDVRAPDGHVVVLTVVNLELEASYNCTNDWLGVAYTNPMQREITMCHSQNTGRILTSSSNFMRIFFHTDGSVTQRGFNITLSAQDGCVPAQLKVVSYNVTSVTLNWIVPNDLNNTHLSFVSLFSSGKEIQNHTTMYKEQRITGLSPFTKYNVSISSLCNGFESIPASIDIDTESCGGNLWAEGSLVSPGFPFSYENNMDCVWDVRAPVGHVVVLTVVNLELEDPNNCPWDWLGVAYTNTTQREITMCQPQNIGRIITSSSNFMRIFFHSDMSVTGRGFEIRLSSQESCGGNLLAEGWLVSPGFPFSYENNMDCVWDVRAPDGHFVMLTVVNLDLEDPNNCPYDWLRVVYTNTMQREITMCQPHNIGQIITSSSNFMQIYFHSDVSVTRRGFNIRLSSQESCGGNLLAEGSLVSPGFPFFYQNNMDCVWDVRAPDGHVAVLTVVNLELENSYNCLWDWLGVAYTNTTQREITMCQPHNIGRIITSSSNFMRIFFHSDVSVTGRGFEIRLSSQESCGGNLLAEGWLVSPGFPLSYENNMDCVWNVRAPVGHVVMLTVLNLDLEDPNNCPYDWLRVVYTNRIQREITMCQPQNTGQIITSNSNFMQIFFHSDGSVTRRGFKIRLSSQESCGGNLLAQSWLLSPGFPFNYANSMDCVWDVRAPDRHVVVLTVENMDLEHNYYCSYDWLGVAYTNTTQREITMCQPQNIGRIITSTSNFMRIFFHSDVSVTGQGFNITLSSQESCGGFLLAEGWLVSPGFPLSYENNMDCVWDVNAPDGHIVVLTVENLDLEHPYNCPYDWLRVVYTNTPQQEITMCQPQNTGRIITSYSNFIRIFFHSDILEVRPMMSTTILPPLHLPPMMFAMMFLLFPTRMCLMNSSSSLLPILLAQAMF
uniref:cubilin-like isoform X2 n=1 Tax=Myxine glutinosa TaxID=7769 RepID=UPI00358E742F